MSKVPDCLFMLWIQFMSSVLNLKRPHITRKTKTRSSIKSTGLVESSDIVCLCRLEVVMNTDAKILKENSRKNFIFLFYRDLNRKSNQVKDCKAKIELLGTYDPQKQLIIEDPYYVRVRNSLGNLIKNCVCASIIFPDPPVGIWYIIWCYTKWSVKVFFVT